MKQDKREKPAEGLNDQISSHQGELFPSTPGVLQFLPAELPSHPMPEAIHGDQGDEPGLGSSTNTHTSTGFMLCASHDGRY